LTLSQLSTSADHTTEFLPVIGSTKLIRADCELATRLRIMRIVSNLARTLVIEASMLSTDTGESESICTVRTVMIVVMSGRSAQAMPTVQRTLLDGFTLWALKFQWQLRTLVRFSVTSVRVPRTSVRKLHCNSGSYFARATASFTALIDSFHRNCFPLTGTGSIGRMFLSTHAQRPAVSIKSPPKPAHWESI